MSFFNRNLDVRYARKASLFALLASTTLASPAFAQAAEEAGSGDEIIVTAQKRAENLQDVPISIQALGQEKLAERQVASFDDYAKLLPSVSFQSFGPGQSQLFFRGISSGGDGLHGGSLPGAGLYVDETPVTTIANSVDIHIYDIARVEALSGPQGTLFGASSLAGTLRIITNKPDASKFEGGVDVQVNKFGKGEAGGILEGFLNLPVSENVALRVVGFYKKDGGYIDNIAGTRTYILGDTDPTTNLTINNAALVKKDFNPVETYGGRAALGIDLNDNWTVTPSIIYQRQTTKGPFLYDPRAGDLNVVDYIPTRNKDRWYQAALTITGQVGNWDLVYSGGYFERKVNNQSDYSEYTVAYDALAGSYYTNFVDAAGNFIDPTQRVILGDEYTKQTHELRVSSPQTDRFRITAGLFLQRQTDDIDADYVVPGLSRATTPIVVPPSTDSLFITRAFRVDRDYAMFADASYDVSDTLTINAGLRGFIAKNTFQGFSGFLSNSLSPICLPTTKTDRPCENFKRKQVESGETHRVTLTFKPNADKLLYATWSTGYRPGGNNRRPGINPYEADTLTNYEFGWKTTWLDRKLRINGAVFYEKWDQLQYGLSPVGSAGVTNIYNAGNARVYGIEGDVNLRLGGLTLSGAGTYIDAKLTTDFCQIGADGNPDCTLGAVAAPKGTRLPVQPKFKGTATARYEFPLGSFNAFLQGSANHQGGTRSYLTDAEAALLGNTNGFTTFDFSVGGALNNWTFEAFIQNAFDKRGSLSINTVCAPLICGAGARIYPIKPQIFGLKAGTRF
jgi:iron complex outermembrane recepter protein